MGPGPRGWLWRQALKEKLLCTLATDHYYVRLTVNLERTSENGREKSYKIEGTQSKLFSVRVVQHVNPIISYLSYQIATTLFRFREAS